MTSEETLTEQTLALLRERGKESLRIAEQFIRQEKISSEQLRSVLDYFIQEVFKDITQPGLLSLYCEAVGGQRDETSRVGAALVLMVGAADLHDDVIDGSETKDQKPTVFGKFGKDLTILAGDALLIEGLYLLHLAVADYSEKKRNAILELVRQAFFGLSSAEIEEATHGGDTNLAAEQYLQIIKKKVAVSEATAKIGGALGNGTDEDLETLAYLGRILGLLNTLRDEFIDVYFAEELENRFANEVLPLPVLYAFRDTAKKEEIVKILRERKVTAKNAERLLDIVMDAKETDELRQMMKSEIQKAKRSLARLKANREVFKALLDSSLDNLQ